MPLNVQEEITEIRERLARIETKLEGLKTCINSGNRENSIVIPVAVVVAFAEVARVLLEHFI